MTRWLWMGALLIAACDTSGAGDDAGAPRPGTDAGRAAMDAALDAGADDAGSDASSTRGADVFVHLRATHAEIAHDPATSGQTPRGWASGIRSLQLLRDRDDASPLLVFTHGDGYVEASYADGADTVVGRAPVASLEPATYTWARVVHTHVRMTVDATAHSGAGSVAGELEELIVLSDRTRVDGAVHARGDYRTLFRGGGVEIPASGGGLELRAASGGGFTVEHEDGETVYYFPILLVVRDDLREDVDLVFEVNVHEGFRWVDETRERFRSGVFDIEAGGTEPVVQAGASAFDYFVE